MNLEQLIEQRRRQMDNDYQSLGSPTLAGMRRVSDQRQNDFGEVQRANLGMRQRAADAQRSIGDDTPFSSGVEGGTYGRDFDTIKELREYANKRRDVSGSNPFSLTSGGTGLETSAGKMGEIAERNRAGETYARQARETGELLADLLGSRSMGDLTAKARVDAARPEEFQSYGAARQAMSEGTFNEALDEWTQNQADMRAEEKQRQVKNLKRFGGITDSQARNQQIQALENDAAVAQARGSRALGQITTDDYMNVRGNRYSQYQDFLRNLF